MKAHPDSPEISRRTLLRRARQAALLPAVAGALDQVGRAGQAPGFQVDAGIDRVAVLPGKTYLRGWVGQGRAPSATRPLNGLRPTQSDPLPSGELVRARWSKTSGPGSVVFGDPSALQTTASFSKPGTYVLRLEAETAAGKSGSTLTVEVEPPAPAEALELVEGPGFRLTSSFWKARMRGIVVNWIPHCIHMINRDDLQVGPGGIDNFIEAGKKLRGEPHGYHKGYVFSNAWVYQTIEAMSLALTCELEPEPEIGAARNLMRETLERWIPIILAAQESDGYLQTAFTLPRQGREGKVIDSTSFKHWDPARRPDHEGYVAGYFLEAAIAHHRMSGGKDRRLYDAAKRLADCWERNIGPPPKQPWFDENQGMEQALVSFGRYVDEVEGKGAGKKYTQLARFLLDCRYSTSTGPRDRTEYAQSHLPVVEQYEAVGHAVRAAYNSSAMADVVIESGDPDYRSAVRSLWANITHRKLYLTGGIGSGETSEGFGPDYSLPERGYCESCASCGELFFQWKVGRIWHDARCAGLYEDTLFNALVGSMDLESKHFYYDNPLQARVARYQWHTCPCCVGNIPRTLLMLPTWMYLKGRDALYVNLFVGSRTVIPGIGGTDVEVIQETEYPWRGGVSIRVNPKTARRFRLHIRVPNRNVSELYRAVPEASGNLSIRVNGARTEASVRNGYAVIDRTWKPGDRVEFEVPLTPQRVYANQKVTSLRGKVALRYGALVYNIEQADQDISKALPKSAPLKAEWREDFLGGVVTLRSQFADGSPLVAIPNLARMNREPGSELPPVRPPQRPDGSRPEPPPLKSTVWLNEPG